MNNLLTAIYGKTSGSALSTYVGDRIYLDEVRQDIVLPYVVFFIVSGMPDKTFTEHYTDTMIQFSLFSDDESGTEIQTMYGNLKTLFDECALTITGSTLVWMRESNLTTMVEDGVKHWAIDYELLTSLN
jgi:hypothetical protein